MKKNTDAQRLDFIAKLLDSKDCPSLVTFNKQVNYYVDFYSHQIGMVRVRGIRRAIDVAMLAFKRGRRMIAYHSGNESSSKWRK